MLRSSSLVMLLAVVAIANVQARPLLVGHGSMDAVCGCGTADVVFKVPCIAGTDFNLECSKEGGEDCKLLHMAAANKTHGHKTNESSTDVFVEVPGRGMQNITCWCTISGVNGFKTVNVECHSGANPNSCCHGHSSGSTQCRIPPAPADPADLVVTANRRDATARALDQDEDAMRDITCLCPIDAGYIPFTVKCSSGTFGPVCCAQYLPNGFDCTAF